MEAALHWPFANSTKEIIMGKFADQWRDAKQKFETATGKKKPSKKFMGKIRKKSSIDALALKVDQADVDQTTKRGVVWNGDTYNKFSAAVEKFKKSSKEYIQFLDDCILEEAPDKRDNAEYYGALKLLRKSLDAILKSIKATQGYGYAAVREIAGAEMMAANFRKSLKAGVARALVSVQKIKNDPTPETYNAQFDKAARDITQNVGNLNRLRDRFPDYELPGINGDDYFEALKPWADGRGGRDLRSVADDATRREVMDNAREFLFYVKQIKTAFRV